LNIIRQKTHAKWLFLSIMHQKTRHNVRTLVLYGEKFHINDSLQQKNMLA